MTWEEARELAQDSVDRLEPPGLTREEAALLGAAFLDAVLEVDSLEQRLARLEEKPNQPVLNAARRLVLATDNAERNAALGDLHNALAAAEPEEGAG